MNQVVVLSGKGGTGKTTLSALIAHRAKACVVDCDVDAANLALLLAGTDGEQHDFHAGYRARVNQDECCGCGRCETTCAFGALSLSDGRAVVNRLHCEGCGACARSCPFDAIELRENLAGHWWVRRLERGVLVHAALGIAQDNSGKLVAEVRQAATKLAAAEGYPFVLIDGPPGIGCPVHASLSQTDLAVLVAEASPSGWHDLQRLIELCDRFHVRSLVALNKCGVNPSIDEAIETLCERYEIPVVARIPFDIEVVRLLAESQLPTHLDSPAGKAFCDLADLVIREATSNHRVSTT